jgi:hypothetical protein
LALWQARIDADDGPSTRLVTLEIIAPWEAAAEYKFR